MKKVLSMVLVFVILFAMVLPVTAHSGRTDKSGGHKDNKNAEGLGDYHYHCKKSKAHLHPDGECPYKDLTEDQVAAIGQARDDSAKPLIYPMSTNISDTNSIEKSFHKFYKNNFFVAKMHKDAPTAGLVRVKVTHALADMDKDNLVFYNYDKANNKISRITEISYFFTKEGDLRFIVPDSKGYVVVSDGQLAKK